MIRFVIFLAVALAGCSPQPGEAVAPEETNVERSLDGEYVVTFVNQAAPVIGIEGYEPTITITGERIHFQSQCIYDDWVFSREGEAISTGPWDYGETVAMCARGLAPGEEAIIAAFDEATTVRFVQGGLWFSGEGGDVQLRRLPSAEELAARDVELTGSWTVTALDGEAIAEPLEIEADFEQIWWEPGCAGQSVRYTIARDSFALIPQGAPGVVCDIGFPPELPLVWEALNSADTIAKEGDGTVTIAGGGRSVTIAPRKAEKR